MNCPLFSSSIIRNVIPGPPVCFPGKLDLIHFLTIELVELLLPIAILYRHSHDSLATHLHDSFIYREIAAPCGRHNRALLIFESTLGEKLRFEISICRPRPDPENHHNIRCRRYRPLLNEPFPSQFPGNGN